MSCSALSPLATLLAIEEGRNAAAGGRRKEQQSMSFLGATSRTVCATTSVANPPAHHEGHMKWQTLATQRNTLSCHATQDSLLPPNATLSLAMQRNTHTLSLSLATQRIMSLMGYSTAAPVQTTLASHSRAQPPPRRATTRSALQARGVLGGALCARCGRKKSGVGRPGMGAPKACSARCMMCRLHSSASSLYIDR